MGTVEEILNMGGEWGQIAGKKKNRDYLNPDLD